MKHLLVLAVLLMGSAALAQEEVMCVGQDSSGISRNMLVDSSGRIVTSSSGGGGQQYSHAEAVTTPVGPMCMGWSGSAANALEVDSAGNLNVNVNTLLAGENLDAGYIVVHLDSTSALSANQSVNVSQINAVTPLMGNGVTGTGSQRVTIASDNTAFSVNATCSQSTATSLKAEVIGTKTTNAAVPGATNVGALVAVANAAAPTLTETYLAALSVDLAGNLRTNVAQINGVTTLMGNGATGTGSQRVTIASDNTTFAVGKLSHNSAAPAATSNVGALVAVANAAPPTLTETYLTTASIDLKGGLRVSTASDTTGATTEVLVLNATDTAMPTTPLTGRRGLEIQNLGPNAIYCSLTAAGSPVLTKSRMIPAVSGSWSAPFGPNIVVECRAGTADQVTGAAAVVTEWQ